MFITFTLVSSLSSLPIYNCTYCEIQLQNLTRLYSSTWSNLIKHFFCCNVQHWAISQTVCLQYKTCKQYWDCIYKTSSYLQLMHWPNKLMLHYTQLERIVRDKHSSLLGPYVSYEDTVKSFEYNHRCLRVLLVALHTQPRAEVTTTDKRTSFFTPSAAGFELLTLRSLIGLCVSCATSAVVIYHKTIYLLL